MKFVESLQKTSDLVERILEEVPGTRSSDMFLYYKVCEARNPYALAWNFGQVIMNLKQFNLPPFESVRRSRQKVQAERPELSANSVVEGYRELNEEVYKGFALKG